MSNEATVADISTRTVWRGASLSARAASFDEKTRSVEAVLTTEAPVAMFDWETGKTLDEVLLMSGMKIAGGAEQVPMLNAHDRYDAASVLGSIRDIRRDGSQLVGRLHFASDAASSDVLTKVREGHLTDVSVGYRVAARTKVAAKESVIVDGKTFAGPASIVTDWRLHEVSLVPIGADSAAKIRAAYEREHPNRNREHPMSENEKGSGDAPPTPAQPESKRTAEVIDTAAIENARKAGIAEERKRNADIAAVRAAFAPLGLTDDEMKVDAGDARTPDELRTAWLDVVSKRSIAKLPNAQITVQADERDKFRAAASDGMLLGAGGKVAKPAPGADEFRGVTLSRLAEDCLRAAGRPVSRNAEDNIRAALNNGRRPLIRWNGRTILGMGSDDFPLILGDVQGKFSQQQYEQAPSTFRAWTSKRSVPDFKSVKVNQLSEANDLEIVLESGEIPQGTFTEKRETYSIATYAKGWSISRQALINDDLGMFARMAGAHAQAAARKQNRLVYQILRNGTSATYGAMSDGYALFDDTYHGNYTASGTAISVTSLGVAFAKMAKQKGLDGTTFLNVRPKTLIVPPDKYALASQVIGSTVDPALYNSTINPFANMFLIVSEPEIGATTDAPASTAGSTTAWYLASDPNVLDTIEVAYLNGQESPVIEEEQAFDTLGMKFRIYMDFGAKAIDWRGLYLNAGA